jgi:hypothetical protein
MIETKPGGRSRACSKHAMAVAPKITRPIREFQLNYVPVLV